MALTRISSGGIVDGTITNADIASDASIDGSKIAISSTAPTDGVYLADTNKVAIATNSADRLYIDSSGYIGIGISPVTANAIRIETPIAGATGGRGIQINSEYSSDCTGSSIVFGAYPSIEDATFTANQLSLFNAGIQTVPAAATVTTLVGFNANGNLVDQATNVYGFQSTINTGTGNNYNVYVNGTADNYFAGNVGIGTESPGELLSLSQDVTTEANLLSLTGTSFGDGEKIFTTFKRSTVNLARIGVEAAGAGQAGHLVFETAASGTPAERARIDSDGRLLVGTLNSLNHGGVLAGLIQVHGDGGEAHVSITRSSDDAIASTLSLSKSRGTEASPTTVDNGDSLGRINFNGYDGTDFLNTGARIFAEVDGSPAEDTMPGKLVFATNSGTDGSVPTQRMTIDSSGNVGIGIDDPQAKIHATGNILLDGNPVINDDLDLDSLTQVKSFSLLDFGTGGETTPTDLFWKPDGTKVYICGQARDSIVEFEVSTPWDISTATKSHELWTTYEDGAPTGFYITPDGFNLYLTGPSYLVFRYKLTKAWDISTASLEARPEIFKSVYVGGSDSTPSGVALKSDGTRVFFYGYTGDRVRSFDLTTAWDLGSADESTLALSEKINATIGTGWGLVFSSDGLNCYISDVDDLGTIRQFALTTAWDITTLNVTPVGSLSSDNRLTDFRDISFKSDGLKMYSWDTQRNILLEFTLTTAWDITTATVTDKYEPDFPTSNYGLTFSNDGTSFFSTNTSTDNLYQFDLDTAWDISTVNTIKTQYLKGISSSPAGLAFGDSGKKLYVLDSGQDAIFEITLDNAYNINTSSTEYLSVLETTGYPGGVGVSVDGDKIYVVDSHEASIRQYATQTPFSLYNASYEKTFSTATTDAGPNGISFSANGKSVIVIGSDRDGIGKYNLSTAWDLGTATLEKQRQIPESVVPQGIYLKYDNTAFWIVDSTSDAIIEYSVGYSNISISSHVSLDAGAEVNGPLTVTDRIINKGNVETAKVIAKNIELEDNLRADNVAVNVEYSIDTATLEAKINYADHTNFNLGLTAPDPRGVFVSGNHMFAVSSDNVEVVQYSLTDGDISTATEVRSLDISAVVGQPIGISFDPTGTKMLITSLEPSAGIFLYELSTAWDLSTATCSLYSATTQSSFNASLLISEGTGLYVNGSNLFILDQSQNLVQQYTLASNYSLGGSITSGGTYSFGHITTQAKSLYFESDGLTMWIAADSSDLYKFDLGTAWDLSTVTYDYGSLTVFDNSQVYDGVNDIVFGDSGSKVYLLRDSSDQIKQFNLSTAWDVSTASFHGNYTVKSRVSGAPKAISFSSDGTKLFVSDSTFDNVAQYDLSTAWDITTANFSTAGSQVDKSGDFTSIEPTGFFVGGTGAADGLRLYVLDSNSATVKRYNLSTAWDITTAGSAEDSYTFTDIEVDCIDFKSDGTGFYVIDQANFLIKQYSVDTAWTLSNVTHVNDYDLRNTSNGNVTSQASGTWSSLRFRADGTGFDSIVIDSSVTYQFSYKLATAWDITSAYYNGSGTVSTSSTTYKEISYSPTGFKAYLLSFYVVSQRSTQLAFGVGGQTTSAVMCLTARGDADTYVVSLRFNDDRTRVYALYENGEIEQFDLGLQDRLETIEMSKVFHTYYYEPTILFHRFSSDGTRLFIGGSGVDKIHRFDLSTAWDLSTASESQVYSLSAYGGAENIKFNSDGTRLYFESVNDGRIYTLSLSTAWDLTTISVETGRLPFSYGLSDSSFSGFEIGGSTADTRFYCARNQVLRQFTLDTAGDLLSIDKGDHVRLATNDNEIFNVQVYTAGSKIFLSKDESIYEFTYTGGDFTTAALNHTVDFADDVHLNGFWIDESDGLTMWACDSGNAEIIEYNLTTAWDLSTLSTVQATFNNSQESRSPNAIAVLDSNAGIWTIDKDTRVVNLLPFPSASAGDLSSISHAGFCDAYGVFLDFVSTGKPRYGKLNDAKWGNSGNSLYVVVHRGHNENISDQSRLLQFNVATAYTLPDNITRRTDAFGTQPASEFNLDQMGGDITTSFDFNADGTRLYTIDYSRDYIANTVLSTAWDISTLSTSVENNIYLPTFFIPKDEQNAAYSTASIGRSIQYISARDSLIVGGSGKLAEISFRTGDDIEDLDLGQHLSTRENSNANYSFKFSPDGLNLYSVGSLGDAVTRYTLTTPFDLTTATYSQQLVIAGAYGATSETNPLGLAFNPYGTEFYFIGTTSDSIKQFTLSTAWDLSTATYTNESGRFDFILAPSGVWFRDNGIDYYVIDYAANTILHNQLATAWDISSGSTLIETLVSSEGDYDTRNLVFKPDGLRFYAIGTSQKMVIEWLCSEPFKIADARINKRIRLQNDLQGYGLDFDTYGTKLFVNLNGTGLVRFNLDNATRAKRLSVDGKVYVNGDVLVSNDVRIGNNLTVVQSVTELSDSSLKDNVQTIENALEKVRELRGVEYDRNDIPERPHQIGVIAQEIERVIPEVVIRHQMEDDKIIRSVAYGNLVGLLIEAIKDQQSQIDDLYEEIKKLKS